MPQWELLDRIIKINSDDNDIAKCWELLFEYFLDFKMELSKVSTEKF